MKKQICVWEQCLGCRQPQTNGKRIPFGAPLYADVNATVAQAYLNLKNQDSAAVYITLAALAEKDKTTKARYRYIEAQLLERRTS